MVAGLSLLTVVGSTLLSKIDGGTGICIGIGCSKPAAHRKIRNTKTHTNTVEGNSGITSKGHRSNSQYS